MSTDNSTVRRSNVKDITGKPFGDLTAISYAGTNLGSQAGAYWLCRCKCGTEKVLSGRALRSGNIQSCGCSKHRIDEIGNKYGLLAVIRFTGTTKSGDSQWECHCDCGNTTIVARGELQKGSTVSCGCHRANARGMCNSPEYTSWKEMKRRCYNTGYPDYHLYGGKGVVVCQRWLDAFVNFFDDMGQKPFPEATIDRIDGNGNYEPANCRWASKKEQSQNTSKTRWLTHNGETLCLREWARRLGVTHATLSRRIAKRWPVEKIFSSEHYRVPPPKKCKRIN